MVPVEREPDPLHDFRSFRIVDGQQRITTLSVAIAALRDVAAATDSSQFERLNAKYLVNSTEPKGADRWARLVPGEEDEQAYWTVLTDPANASGTPRWAPRTASRLGTTIGDRLSLVFVTVDEGERPHKILESINATGVGLSQSDLLRNYLFMALGERSDSVYKGTAAQPTANHVSRDPSVLQAHRVLGSDGSVSFNFQWHDESDTRDPVEVLIGEGVEFDEGGRANQAQRLGPAELEALLDSEPITVA